MANGEQSRAAFAERIAGMEMLASLRRALDLAYARLSRAAAMRWKNNFRSTHDTSERIVSVRVTTAAQTARGSAFLSPRSQTRDAGRRHNIRPRFAD
jgi:hypothetical protein